MENKPILFEWALNESQDKRKRNVNAIIILIIFLLLFLSLINFLLALIINAFIVIIWNFIHSQPKKKENIPVETYKITEEGIFIDRIKTGVKAFYPWEDLSYFEGKQGGISILGSIVPSFANDDIRITKINKQNFILRAPDNNILSKIGSALTQKLPFRTITRSSEYSAPKEIFYDARSGGQIEINPKNHLLDQNIAGIKEDGKNAKKFNLNLIFRIVGIFLPLIIIWGFYGDEFKTKDFKIYMPKEKVESVSVVGTEVILKKGDKNFNDLINNIYKIDTSESLIKKIELFFSPADRTNDVIKIANEKLQGLNQEFLYMDICSIDNYCLSADYNSTTNKITFNNIKPVKGDLMRENITILKSYNINLNNIFKEILAR